MLLLPGAVAFGAGGDGAGKDARSADLHWTTGAPSLYKAHNMTRGTKPPEGVKPLPATVTGGATVLYATRPLGDRRLLVAAQLVDEPLWIRVDRDFDGDLDDEETVNLVPQGIAFSTTVTLPLATAGGSFDAPLLFVHHHNPGKNCLHLAVRAHQQGEVVLADRLRKVVLAGPKYDVLILDLQGDGEILLAEDSPDRVVPGTAFRVGDEGWTARVSGARVEFARAAEVPPAAPRWKPSNAPKAGVTPSRRPAPLDRLLAQYDAAEKQDEKAGNKVVTNRSRVVGLIGQEGSEEAFRHLLRMARKERNVSLRAAAVRALGYRHFLAHADQVFEFARGSAPPAVRAGALDALRGMDAPGREPLLLDLVASENQATVFGAAARHLGYLDTAEGRRVLDAAVLEGTVKNLRLSAYQGAVRYRADPPPKEVVLAGARSGVPALVAEALGDAFELGLPEARDRALEVLDSGETLERLVKAAVRILGAAGDPASVKALLAAAAAPDFKGARPTVELLSAVRREDSIAVLLAGLAAGPPAERAVAAEILGAIPGDAVSKALLARLDRERDEAARGAVFLAVAGRGDPGAATKIAKAIDVGRASADVVAAALSALARAGLADPAVREVFDRAAKDRDWRKRVVAMTAAGECGDESLVDMLLEGLGDEAWQVRLGAAEALGKIRVRLAVAPLIDQLDDEDSPRVRQAIANTLYVVTGQNFYDIVKFWKRWWKENGETFEVPVEVPKPLVSDHGGGGSRASFYGLPVESDRVIFVIDQSGSMNAVIGGKQKLARAVEETLNAVKKLGRRARANVIFFESGIHPWQDRLVPLSKAARAKLAEHLKSKRPLGGTNLYDALEMALRTEGVDSIYLLSDGVPGLGRYTIAEDILREVKRINRTRMIAIHCVSVGQESPLLRKLAAQNGGGYVRR